MELLPIFISNPDSVLHYNSGALFDDSSSCGEDGHFVYTIEETTCASCLAEEWSLMLGGDIYKRYEAFREATKCNGIMSDFLSLPENADVLQKFLADNPKVAHAYFGHALTFCLP